MSETFRQQVCTMFGINYIDENESAKDLCLRAIAATKADHDQS